jgi:hypothetical protein
VNEFAPSVEEEDPRGLEFFEENVRVNQFGFLSGSDEAFVAIVLLAIVN